MNQTVSIKYFSVLSEITGKRQEKLAIRKGDSLEDLFISIQERFPGIEKYRPHIRAAVNQNYEEFEFKPKENDEIVFITPVSGG
jgi:molybdopterin converting factor small subunit